MFLSRWDCYRSDFQILNKVTEVGWLESIAVEHLSAAKALPVLALRVRENSAAFLPGWLRAGAAVQCRVRAQPLHSAAPALGPAFPARAGAASCALPCSWSS